MSILNKNRFKILCGIFFTNWRNFADYYESYFK